MKRYYVYIDKYLDKNGNIREAMIYTNENDSGQAIQSFDSYLDCLTYMQNWNKKGTYDFS